jgi:hypothetical protein
MKPIKKEITEDGTIKITVQTTNLFGLIKRNTVYSSTKVLAGIYRHWLKEPNKLLVNDIMSLQLDHWNQSM